MDRIIQVRKLYDRSYWGQWDGHFKYSKYAEAVACEWLARKKGWIVESVICENSDYDAIVSGKKIEVKFQSSRNLSLEYCTDRRIPSGIMTTKSDFYLMINVGSTHIGNGDWLTVGKVRLIPTQKLQKLTFESIEKHENINHFPGVPGSYCVEIDPKSLNGTPSGDGYIGDVGYKFSQAQGVEYNFGELPNLSNNFHDRVGTELDESCQS